MRNIQRKKVIVSNIMKMISLFAFSIALSSCSFGLQRNYATEETNTSTAESLILETTQAEEKSSSIQIIDTFSVVQGKYDYMVSQVLAEQYFQVIDAPKKEFFMFEGSAHSPNMEEPYRFVKVMRKIAEENP